MLWQGGANGAEIHRRLQAVCGGGAPCERTVRNWISSFREGRGTTEDAHLSGRPATSVTAENIEQVDAMLTDDRNITLGELAEQIGIRVE